MKMLITGAFGNIGKAVIEEAHKRNHKIIVFEIENKKTRKVAKKYRNKVKEVIFGDIRNLEDVKKAVQQSETSDPSCSNNSTCLKKTSRINYGY